MCVRGEIWWADLGEPQGSEPGNMRPVVVVQSDAFNRSRIATTIVASITSNLSRAEAPGNVLLKRRGTGLRKDSVVNVSQLATVDRAWLTNRIGRVGPATLQAIDDGLNLVLGLSGR